jgi:hypothetical protein
MGWARLLFLGEGSLQMDIEVQAEELRRLREQARVRKRDFDRADHELDVLKEENDQLKTALGAVVRLLVSKNILSNDEVTRIVGLVELEGEP